MVTTDTIVAQVTPPGCGGVGILRLSGPLVNSITTQILSLKPQPRYATCVNFLGSDNTIIDQGIAILFVAPHSFTGEDVLELHCHGSQVILDGLLQRSVALGARLAKPGEFSERAFLNNKLDLTQAEAIVDLINASTKEAAKNAMRSLQGEFSKRVNTVITQIIELRVYLEAAIDFTEEDLDLLTGDKLRQKITAINNELATIQAVAEQGMILREGIRAVITGKPNAGKSSLLNILSGSDTAIVTPIPGTTRDVLHTQIQINGLAINLLDTAGLRDNPDMIESEGIRRAWEEIKKADHILVMVDASQEKLRDAQQIVKEFAAVMPEHARITLIYNKIDLTNENPQLIEQHGITTIYLSVKQNLGIDLLRQHLQASVGFKSLEGGFSARRRHLEALAAAQQLVLQAQQELTKNSVELAAEDLNLAHRALGTITGEFTSEDLLERIFAEFCIGK